MPDLDTLAGDPQAHHADLTYLMSVISAWAYADERVLAAKLRYYGLADARIHRFTVRNGALLVATTAYLIRSASGRSGVLAFRGTEPSDLIDVLTDAQTNHRRFLDGNVHLGFYIAAEVVWDDIHEVLDRAVSVDRSVDDEGLSTPPPQPLSSLFVTGHSLGGAIAVLTGARLTGDHDALIQGIYTFGQPTVGDGDFSRAAGKRFGRRLHRHVFRNDPVPRLPPRTLIEYAHIGGERRERKPTAVARIKRLGQPPASFPRWDLPRASASEPLGLITVPLLFLNALEARASNRDLLPGPSIDDHSPLNYLEVSRGSRQPEP